MAHEIIEAYLNGVKVCLKEDNSKILYKTGIYLSCQGIITSDDYQSTLARLLIKPDDFELYQEPKKAWVETKGFEDSLINMGAFNVHKFRLTDAEQGAIALVREFVKRYYTNDGYSLNDIKNGSLCKILIELVGEENL